MTLTLRIALIAFALALDALVMKRIKKSTLEVSDSIFWLVTSLVLIIVAFFPGIAYETARLFGFDAPSNFTFFCGIVVLLIRTLNQDKKITSLKKKLTTLTQNEALRRQ